MTKTRVILLVSGTISACLLLTGILFTAASETCSAFGGVAVICLSLASGMILPNPISFSALLAGICMLVFPSEIVGGIVTLLGVTGMITSGVLWRKRA